MSDQLKGKYLYLVLAMVLFLGAGIGGMGSVLAQQPKLTKLTIIEPNRIVSYVPVYLAIAKGYFRDEGLEVEILSGGGGAGVNPALLHGDAQFAITSGDTELMFVNAKRDVVSLLAINTSFIMQTMVSKAYAEKTGISPKAPLAQKIAALKGATMGAIALGGSHETFLRYNMVLGGLDPKDVTVVQVGAGPAMVAAMETGRIDGFEYGFPLGRQVEQRGSGYIWIDPAEVPAYKNMAWEDLLATRSYVEKNPDLTAGVVRAIARGINFTVDHPSEVIPAVQSFFKGMPDEALQAAFDDGLSAFTKNGLMNQEMWDNMMKPLQAMKTVGDLDTRENGFWTNSYIVNIPKD
jgi:ABC-type nitrate/sulfonate/bicarbonate transport system substrate-binding protein